MNRCYLCGSTELSFIKDIEEKPVLETDFNINKADYFRKIYKCDRCGIYNNFHEIDFSNLYSGDYNEKTYNNKINEKYSKIMNLPVSKSDNKNRVQRILNFLESQGIDPSEISALDIGSGLCVFLGEFKKYVNITSCLDPDPISSNHAEVNVGVTKVYCATLEEAEIDIKFDFISLNKVIEHVKDPCKMLTLASNLLNENGIIYVEVPDGDNALKNGKIISREEFYIEHFTIFNKSSLKYLANAGKLIILDIKEIHEPSDKFTLYAFLQKKRISTN